MKALSFLCQRSIQIYQKDLKKKNEDEAEEDPNMERGVIAEDENEDIIDL